MTLLAIEEFEPPEEESQDEPRVPKYVGRIIGPVCDPDDEEAMHRLRPATTYIGERIRLVHPECYDDPTNGCPPTVDEFWRALELADRRVEWRAELRRRRASGAACLGPWAVTVGAAAISGASFALGALL